jgi:lantibiotic modifying enzyme
MPPASHLPASALSDIVARAATLAERLDGGFLPCDDAHLAAEDAPADVARRLARWKQLSAAGDAERFERRLRFDGISPDEARRALGPVRLAHDHRLPPWAVLLADSFVDCEPAEGADPAFRAGSPIRHERVLLPLLAAARRRLEAGAGRSLEWLSARARTVFERGLLRQLSALASPVLDASWDEYRVVGGLAGLFGEYSALARLLSVSAVQWADATAELTQRLDADAAVLAAAFNGGATLGTVLGARPALSDPHRGGRSVCILDFAGGMSIVYKPRSLALDRAFAEVVRCMGDRMAEPRLTALRTIQRGGYGWIEQAIPAECGDEEGVQRYFERAGMLLATVYALCGGDLHEENIIACGERPVPIDLEVLAAPLLRAEGLDSPSGAEPWTQVADSVLATAMLPVLRARFDGTATSSGGLTIHPDRPGRPTNVPSLAGAPVRDPYPQAVLAGFERMYRALVANREELVAPNGPLAALDDAKVRIVLRPTRVYMAVLERCTAPRYLRSGVDRSIELDVLRRPFTRYAERHRLWTVLSSELNAMETLDVPVFEVDGNGTALLTACGVVNDYVTQSGAERVRARLRAMDDADLHRQAHFIRLAYAADRHRRESRIRNTTSDPLLGAALDAAQLLERIAVPTDGGVTWQGFGPSPMPGALGDIGPSLAAGRAGIALFFAAMGSVTGAETHRRLTLAAFGTIIKPGDDPAALTPDTPVGAARGDGGMAYALATAGRLLNEPSLLDTAERVAARITLERIRGAKRLDVWDGVAGALLGLLAVHDATGSEEAFARAQACGRRLTDAGWCDALADSPATGASGEVASRFWHGELGIALALASLHGRSRRRGVQCAAVEPQTFNAAIDAGLMAVCHDSPYGGEPPLEKPDDLYAGNLGRAELLAVAGRRFGRHDLTELARATAHSVSERARRRGTYGGGILDSAFSPGLFHGLAGIGYEMLRLRNGADLSSLLLLE